jgi:hypothetical protein
LIDAPLKQARQLADNSCVARLLVKANALRNSAALRLQDAGQQTRFVRAAMVQAALAKARTQTIAEAYAFVLRSNLVLNRPV